MKFMTVREFMRGGYKTLTEATIVSSHGRPIFTVMPAAGADIRTVSQAVRGTHALSGDARPLNGGQELGLTAEEAETKIAFGGSTVVDLFKERKDGK